MTNYNKLNLSESFITALSVSYFTKILCLISPAELLGMLKGIDKSLSFYIFI